MRTGRYVTRGTPCPALDCDGELRPVLTGVTLVTDDGRLLGGSLVDEDGRSRAPYVNGDLFGCEACGQRVVSGFNAEVARDQLDQALEEGVAAGDVTPALSPEMRRFVAARDP
jgi:hypothetical protein